ncbi:class F sortase [Kribbella voronezhensis]|uniref:class F sortase n=1 Tax=Kribbella voronezhensis TaxID=2512212 RepID=UPI00106425D9|nr:class F sortase [Kribbella voronezhensis]
MTLSRRGAATLVVAALTCTALAGLTACGDPEVPGDRPSTSVSRPTGPRSATPPAPPSSLGTHAADLPTVAAPSPVPIRLVVAGAALTMPVKSVGVGADGQMALPADPSTIGWYRFGPGPADRAGSVVLGGHLDSREFGVGPLARLRKVRPGDLIEITMTDGTVAGYRVTTVKDIPKQKLAVDDLFDREGSRRLRIVTCGGPYDADAGGYRDNLVVTAVASS